jgi:hypothetical protein
MRRWPWITGVLALVAALNPVGLGFISSAFFSSEQLSRNIARPFVLIAAALILVLGALEWGVRTWLSRRRHPPPAP